MTTEAKKAELITAAKAAHDNLKTIYAERTQAVADLDEAIAGLAKIPTPGAAKLHAEFSAYRENLDGV